MDALKIEKAVLGGYDWGARTVNIVAALWPQRVKALVSVSGYLIGSQGANRMPLPPKAEQDWWYQYYFATERGRLGYQQNTHAFAPADLADRIAPLGLRRRHLRTQRGLSRQSRSRRYHDPQLPLAA
jgi:pimeloyl-ACP methyl ester carboxylesterase